MKKKKTRCKKQNVVIYELHGHLFVQTTTSSTFTVVYVKSTSHTALY